MSQCVVVNPDNTLSASTVCDYVMLTQQELLDLQLSGLSELLNSVFVFDLETFAFLNASLITAFVVGHGVGRVARLLGKT